MTANNNLLIEIGTEELPPKALQRLSGAFTAGVVDGLSRAGFECGPSQSYATPRRLAILINGVPAAQPEQNIEKKGPSLKAAYDKDGKPTRALEGFARSCGVSIDQLEKQETEKGAWLVFKAVESGKSLAELLPDIINQSLARLPIPKRMRWGDSNTEFVRPVHWLVILHGKETIEAEILGLESSNETYGHRFHANAPISIASADHYADLLKTRGYVVADINDRKAIIRTQVERVAEELGGEAIVNDDLLDEVTALVEWPTAIAGGYDRKYLDIPPEVLIKTMQDNQKYFAVVDKSGALKPNFITISNIDSKTPEKIRSGNERVINPRFSDAAFFWDQDRKLPLESFLPRLDHVVFQEKLGSLGEKTQRVIKLTEIIASELGVDARLASRAAKLSKCDLMSEMVGEFPALQGVMGRYYAQECGEEQEVALAIEEQYWPRHAGDSVPTSTAGQLVSISEKIDTLVGVFAIGQKPTGEKDPYALRRSALGALRVMIECGLDLDLRVLIDASSKLFPDKLGASKITEEVFAFMIERLRVYYLSNDVPVDVFDSVSALRPSNPLDFDKRIKAVRVFRELPEAESLAAANKRVGNILKKSGSTINTKIDEGLLEDGIERELFTKITKLSGVVEPLFDQGKYEEALQLLSSLKEPIDNFFDSVMVMVEDSKLQGNRIALLNNMSSLFLRTADLSRLHQDPD